MIPDSQFKKPLEKNVMNDLDQLDHLVIATEKELVYVRPSVFGIIKSTIQTQEAPTAVAWHDNTLYYGCEEGKIYKFGTNELVNERTNPILQLFSHKKTLYDLVKGGSKSTLFKTLQEDSAWHKTIEGNYCVAGKNIAFVYHPEQGVDGCKQWIGEIMTTDEIAVRQCTLVKDAQSAERFAIAADRLQLYWVLEDRVENADKKEDAFILPFFSQKIRFSDTFLYAVPKDNKNLYAINRETKLRRTILEGDIKDYTIVPKEAPFL